MTTLEGELLGRLNESITNLVYKVGDTKGDEKREFHDLLFKAYWARKVLDLWCESFPMDESSFRNTLESANVAALSIRDKLVSCAESNVPEINSLTNDVVNMQGELDPFNRHFIAATLFLVDSEPAKKFPRLFYKLAYKGLGHANGEIVMKNLHGYSLLEENKLRDSFGNVPLYSIVLIFHKQFTDWIVDRPEPTDTQEKRLRVDLSRSIAKLDGCQIPQVRALAVKAKQLVTH